MEKDPAVYRLLAAGALSNNLIRSVCTWGRIVAHRVWLKLG